MTSGAKKILKGKFDYELSRNLSTLFLLIVFGFPLMYLTYSLLENSKLSPDITIKKVMGTILILSLSGVFASLLSLVSLALRVKIASFYGPTTCLASLEYCNLSSKKTLFSHPGILTVDSSNRVKILNWRKEVLTLDADTPLTLIDTESVAIESHFFGLKRYKKRSFQVLSREGPNLLVEGFDIEKSIEELRAIRGNVRTLTNPST